MKPEEQRARLHGQLVADFANASGTDDACFKLFENMQKSFGFSSRFAKRAREVFPSLKILGQLPSGRKGQLVRYHKRIESTLSEVRQMLEYLITKKRLHLNKNFLDSLALHNTQYGFCLKINKDDSFSLDPIFSEEDYFVEHFEDTVGLPEWEDTQRAIFNTAPPCEKIIPISLVEFLRFPKNRKLIRKCISCGKFFIASKDDKRIKKCPVCSPKSSMSKEDRRTYQREYNRRRKEEKEKRELEARIQNLIRNLDCTREEAIKTIEEDAKL